MLYPRKSTQSLRDWILITTNLAHFVRSLIFTNSYWFVRFDEVKPKFVIICSQLRSNWLQEASPKAISGRTSYNRVRLAFHHYPQLILWRYTTNRFGPPPDFRQGSPWSWVAHPASGLTPLIRSYLATARHFATPTNYEMLRKYEIINFFSYFRISFVIS